MKIDNLLIHLHNSVDAFSLKPRHVDRIREMLPDVHITVAAGNHDFMEKLPEAECALVWSFKPEWYANAPELRALFTPAAGMTGLRKIQPGELRRSTAAFTVASRTRAPESLQGLL